MIPVQAHQYTTLIAVVPEIVTTSVSEYWGGYTSDKHLCMIG